MNPAHDTLVRAKGLCKQYGSGGSLIRAVDGIDLEVLRGESLAVMGPSGCGKSTLLHLLGGLDRPSAGEVWLNEHRLDKSSERALAEIRRHEVGFVFQAFFLMDELTAQENVEFRRSWPGGHRARRAVGLGSSSSRSGFWIAPITSLLPSLEASVSASRSHERSRINLSSSSPTSRAATSTAPPRWRSCGFSRISTARV